MIEVLSSDYIRTAFAKGATRGIVIWRHAMRNALIPYLTVGAVEFGFLFGGVVIIEDIFLLPGIGSLVLVGIINRDYPVLLAAALVITVVVLTANMIVDIMRRPARSAPGARQGGANDNGASHSSSRRSRRHQLAALAPAAIGGGCSSAIVVLCAVFADVVAPYSPYDLDVANMLQAPSAAHWLGTDEVGRDVLSRTIFAARISVEVALVAVGVGLIGGTIIGILAAYFGGWIDLGADAADGAAVLLPGDPACGHSAWRASAPASSTPCSRSASSSFPGFRGWRGRRPTTCCASNISMRRAPSA